MDVGATTPVNQIAWRQVAEQKYQRLMDDLQVEERRQRVEQLNKLGKWVACYTVNDIDRAQQLFDIGVGTVFTDNMQLCEYFQ